MMPVANVARAEGRPKTASPLQSSLVPAYGGLASSQRLGDLITLNLKARNTR